MFNGKDIGDRQVRIHGENPASMGKDQSFPNSIEVQLLDGNGEDERPTANICTTGNQFVLDGEVIQTHCINTTSPTFKGEE